MLIVNAATINVEPTSTTLYRPVTSSSAPDADDADQQHLTRHVEVHRLEDQDAAADQSGYLEHEPEIHEEPEPEQPRHAQARPRNGVQRLERRDALDDRKARQLDLHEHLDDAAEDDEPQHREAERGADFRRDDELARSDDGRTDDESGTEVRRGAEPAAGRIEKLAWVPWRYLTTLRACWSSGRLVSGSLATCSSCL